MRSDKFRQLVAANPENELFRFSLGQALFEEKSYAEAIESLKSAVSGREDWMVPRILLGKAYLALNQTAHAEKWLKDALQLAIDQQHEDPEVEIRAMLDDL